MRRATIITTRFAAAPPSKPLLPPQLLGVCHHCHATAAPSSVSAPARTRLRPMSNSPQHRRAESLQQETHYDFFPDTLPRGPPPRGSFAVNLKQLRREFLQLQATAHPDRHPGAMKGRAEALSARINEAYKTLQDPLLRAQYILELQGIDVARDETATVEDQGLLMAVLEAREEIEEAREERELKILRETNDGRLDESVRVLEEAFAKGDLERAKVEAVKLRYWVNVRESIESWVKGEPLPNLQH